MGAGIRRATLLAVIAALLSACGSSAPVPRGPDTGPSASPSVSGVITGNPHGTFEARPLVAPGVPVRAGRSDVRVGHLGFELPGEEGTYDRLSTAHKASLATALSAVRCADAGPAGAQSRVVCTSDTNGPTALLTGRPVLTSLDVASARAVPPGSGITQWTIQITLTPAGRRALTAYTTAHHGDQSQTTSPTTLPTQCASATVPCADYVALITRGVAVSVPLTLAPITNGVIAISGPYTATSATALARQIAS